MRRLRGARIAMILQDPMASLNPALTVGAQIAETLALHRGLRGAGLDAARARAAAPGAHQRPRAPRARLSAPDERRHPPARGRGDRDLLPAEPAHRRRADDVARRHDPGAVPTTAQGHPAGDEPGAGLRHPRPRHRGQALRPRRRHVRRAHRRDRDHAGRSSTGRGIPTRSACSTACRRFDARPRAADGDRRPAARSRPRPGRLRLRAALRAGRNAVHADAALARDRWRRSITSPAGGPPRPRRRPGDSCPSSPPPRRPPAPAVAAGDVVLQTRALTKHFAVARGTVFGPERRHRQGRRRRGLRPAAGRDAGARGRERLRQDDHRPARALPREALRGQRPLPRPRRAHAGRRRAARRTAARCRPSSRIPTAR